MIDEPIEQRLRRSVEETNLQDASRIAGIMQRFSGNDAGQLLSDVAEYHTRLGVAGDESPQDRLLFHDRGAEGFLRVLMEHPIFYEDRSLAVGVPVLGDIEPNPIVAELRRASAELLVAGALAVGFLREPSDRFADALTHVAVGADALNSLLRTLLQGKPIRNPADVFHIPERLVDLIGDVAQQTCLLGLRHALGEFGRAADAAGKATSWSTGIAALTPNQGCAGTAVTISGNGFGASQPANVNVWFPREDGGCLPAEVVQEWTDDHIVVEAPPGVGRGCVGFVGLPRPNDSGSSLAEAAGAVAGEMVSCLGPIAIPAAQRLEQFGGFLHIPCPPCLPNDANRFSGGAPLMTSLTVDGSNGPLSVALDSDVTIAWAAEPTTNTTVTIYVRQITHGIGLLQTHTGLPATGSLIFHTPAVNDSAMLEVIATANNACGSLAERVVKMKVTVLPTLVIEGMEVTQGIQSFWRPNVTWNSVPTVANKDTIVRVYVSTDIGTFDGGTLNGVTGTLKVDNTTLTPINGYSPDGSTTPNPFIDARKRQDIHREITSHTLNFRIPAALSSGTKTLVATVQSPKVSGVVPKAISAMPWTWQVKSPLRVRFVRMLVNLAPPEPVSRRPTEVEARYTIERAFDLIPAPANDIAPAWLPTWDTSGDLFTLDGVRDILRDLDWQHNCYFWEWLWAWTGTTGCPEPDNALWIALTARGQWGVARRPGNTAISQIYEISDGWQGNRMKTAHEIGHLLGLKHVNRGCFTVPEGPFSNLPNNGELQDVAFDPYWNQALDNLTDFMSYGCNRWTSRWSWNSIRARIP